MAVAEPFVLSDDEMEDDDMLDPNSSQSKSVAAVADAGGTSGDRDQGGGSTSKVTSPHTALAHKPVSGYEYVDSAGHKRPASFPICPPQVPLGSEVGRLRLLQVLDLVLQEQGKAAKKAGFDACAWLEVRAHL